MKLILSSLWLYLFHKRSLKEEQQKIGKLLGLFAPYVDIYLDLCKEKLQKCTMAAFKSDKWQALNDDDDDDDDDQHRVLHSGYLSSHFLVINALL